MLPNRHFDSCHTYCSGSQSPPMRALSCSWLSSLVVASWRRAVAASAGPGPHAGTARQSSDQACQETADHAERDRDEAAAIADTCMTPGWAGSSTLAKHSGAAFLRVQRPSGWLEADPPPALHCHPARTHDPDHARARPTGDDNANIRPASPTTGDAAMSSPKCSCSIKSSSGAHTRR